MSAPTHTAHRTTETGRRLTWWSVALPVAAFVVLLTLVTGPGRASAAAGPADATGVAYLLERILSLLPL
ncbi:hypothetical protein ACFYVL_37140 [Streptomyces sp. NPDC004111]|uniref:hypothetical protein n=1 Tax=Streptomyces sp. NPDC004111 TaxID=3364690 RepID=UPI0036A042F2